MSAPRLQVRRLLKLASYLEKLPELYKKPVSRRKKLPGFDMSTFGQPIGRGNEDLFSPEFLGEAAPECGTVACAGGHATYIPEFRKLGLHMTKAGRIGIRGHKGMLSSFEALALFFGMTDNQSELLFVEQQKPGVRYYDTDRLDPVAVAQRLRKFVADHKPKRAS